ncbi:hypothetical protein LCGC14_2337780 [marine sediment metagenome]|uniref:Uncharacterized protein n=1 Tax=marine sediment metagenome TaxID=412755 RepID=A0A0F9CCT6_9ZZZZ
MNKLTVDLNENIIKFDFGLRTSLEIELFIGTKSTQFTIVNNGIGTNNRSIAAIFEFDYYSLINTFIYIDSNLDKMIDHIVDNEKVIKQASSLIDQMYFTKKNRPVNLRVLIPSFVQSIKIGKKELIKREITKL